MEAIGTCSPRIVIADYDMLMEGDSPLVLQVSENENENDIVFLVLMDLGQTYPQWYWKKEPWRNTIVSFLAVPLLKGELNALVSHIVAGIRKRSSG